LQTEGLTPSLARVGRNLAMGAITVATTALLQKPLVSRTPSRFGLLQRMRLPKPVRFVAGVLLLDYTLWWWHRWNHTVPALWRFHRVHHIDRQLDVTTALRFHFGEMGLAALFRAAQIAVLGVDRDALAWWQRMLLLSIFFHHSNLRLPKNMSHQLVTVIVTPQMHAIHHSEIEAESNSNWASLFTWWDKLHRTFLYDGRPRTIGAPDWDLRQDPGIGELLAIPFRETSARPRSPRSVPSSR
jgi:sterol desaturase/sphingolipid hydroxylase (fatty acid hydroxylase superfamily)